MKLLLVVRGGLDASDGRRVEALLPEVLARGHELHVVVDRDAGNGGAAVERACREVPRVACTPQPAFPFNAWSYFGRELRRAIDSGDVGVLPSLQPLAKTAAGRRLLDRVLRWCERSVPSDAAVDAFIRAQAPDAVIVAPAAAVGSFDVDYERSARRLGIPVAVIGDGAAAGANGHGIVAALPGAIARLESGAARRAPRGPWFAPLLRVPLSRAAQRLALTERARNEKAARQERIRHDREASVAARRAGVAAEKQRAAAESARRREDEKARAQAERDAVKQVAATAFEHYREVREWVRRLREHAGAAGGGAALTVRERDVLAGLAWLEDASPETIALLRRHCEPISGVRVADYEPGSAAHSLEIRSRLGVLWRHVGRDLYVPESRTLGGFGYPKNEELYNEDTLKFFTALVALQDGGVLGGFRGNRQRRLVWEIGGGWGGFAYQFKQVCPNTTYLITGSPELLLVSAVYLMAAVPGARCRFYDPSAPDDLWSDWHDADFVFAPESALPAVRPPQLDLAIDLMTLRDMTPARRCAHTQHAFDLGGRFFYSMLPGSLTSDEREAVWSSIAHTYWLHPVPPRRDQIKTAAGVIDRDPAADAFQHVVGWKRIRV